MNVRIDYEVILVAKNIWRNWSLNCEITCFILRTVPTIVIARTFCASPDTWISYRQCLLTQGSFCAV